MSLLRANVCVLRLRLLAFVGVVGVLWSVLVLPAALLAVLLLTKSPVFCRIYRMLMTTVLFSAM